MKKIEDLLKDSGIINAEKLFKADGNVDEDYLEILAKERPILPDPIDDTRLKYLSVKENRERYEEFPDRLPTRGLQPFPVDAHELIGQFESKHNLYLTTAGSYNKAQDRIDDLLLIIDSLVKRVLYLENKGEKNS